MATPAVIFPSDATRRAGEVEGQSFGSDVSVIVVEYRAPGMGPKLNTHPYAETFVVLEGRARFEVGGERFDAVAGMALVVGTTVLAVYQPVLGSASLLAGGLR